MLNKKVTYLLIFVLLCCSFAPVIASDTVYVWSDNSAPEAVTTSALLRRKGRQFS